MSEELKEIIEGSVEDTRYQIMQLIKLGDELFNSDDEHINHGPTTSMGVPKNSLPRWDNIQIITAQLAQKPLLDHVPVASELVVGPRAEAPLKLELPLFVSDMSYGALSRPAKQALATGADYANTGICSGEGGILEEEVNNNQRYFFEMGTARNGIKKGEEQAFFERNKGRVKAFHFKGGQGAKTGTGGHLPAAKVTEEISKIRGIPMGEAAISPATFEDFECANEFKDFADMIRQGLGGIPVGFKLSANHIERDIAFALEASADYIILDGRGGSTGAAPLIFRDHISVPTIPALARARAFLDAQGLVKGGPDSVTLIITGGLRLPSDFIKALALGADGIALSNSAIQAIGCIGARICNTDRCPAGIATQSQYLYNKINIMERAKDLAKFFHGSVHLMKIIARACGHDALWKFAPDDLSTWDADMARLAHVHYAGEPR